MYDIDEEEEELDFTLALEPIFCEYDFDQWCEDLDNLHNKTAPLRV